MGWEFESPPCHFSRLLSLEGFHNPLPFAVFGLEIPLEERDRLRQDLLNYCERDMWAMVMLLKRLRELAAL